MLELKNISKKYIVADKEFVALKEINLKFRKNEFVSILGPSGSGKTTLLNIIGGLDKYSDGDLVIRGTSTKKYKDRDWDKYRNHSVGFVFQSYNLINHQSVLSNVELALTLSGVKKKERRERAIETLNKVGLGDHIHKKPTQLSGGQMQRVAIARALINDPEILLADEPTGALDTSTSEVIMELLKEIANDRLVIMVTHNPELAIEYSSRIISLRDGEVQDDTNIYEDVEETEPSNNYLGKKTSMSFFTALSLSFNNLLTKKSRTLLTAFAGSIGIMGIALIISLSSGANNYIDKIQQDTLTTYPISIQDKSIDLNKLFNIDNQDVDEKEFDENVINSRPVLKRILENQLVFSQTNTNNLSLLKKHLEKNSTTLDELTNAIDYGYNIILNLYKKIDGEIVKLNTFDYLGGNRQRFNPLTNQSTTSIFYELMGNKSLLESQYDLVDGRWPESKEELVLFVDKNNQISDLAMYQVGIKNPKEISSFKEDLSNEKDIEISPVSIETKSLLGTSFKYIPNTEFFEKVEEKWLRKSNQEEVVSGLYDSAMELKIVGIVKANPNSNIEARVGEIGYTKALTDYIIENVNSSEIAKEQMQKPNLDIFTNKEFVKEGQEIKAPDFESLDESQKAYILSLPENQREEAMLEFSEFSPSSYKINLETIGALQFDSPSAINIYPKDYKSKDALELFLKEYNETVEEANKISYNDLVGLMMRSITTIINVITYLLIAFISISLVVSSIMIGIITYVSVLERTKEIGILKSIGASKRDISRVFNAETVIVGLLSGFIGIITTLLLIMPINSVIERFTKVANFSYLPVQPAILLIALSTTLTIIAGLIPSRIAAKKDPVESLRSE